MAPPDPRDSSAPDPKAEGEALSKSDATSNTAKSTPTRKRPDSGAVMECVFAACVGRPVCPWAPWSCVIGGNR